MLGAWNTCVRLQSRVINSGATVNCSMILFYFYIFALFRVVVVGPFADGK